MRLFRRQRPATPAPPPLFGPWLLRHFAQGEPTAAMPFARLEQVCSNAGSVLCGAAYSDPASVAGATALDGALAAEAALVAKRTGDGFKACLEDRQHTIISWPWDHLATRVAWEATRGGDASEEVVGRRLGDIGAAYAARHREQLATVFGLWEQVVAGLATPVPVDEPPSLVVMGRQLLAAFQVERAAS